MLFVSREQEDQKHLKRSERTHQEWLLRAQSSQIWEMDDGITLT